MKFALKSTEYAILQIDAIFFQTVLSIVDGSFAKMAMSSHWVHNVEMRLIFSNSNSLPTIIWGAVSLKKKR